MNIPLLRNILFGGHYKYTQTFRFSLYEAEMLFRDTVLAADHCSAKTYLIRIFIFSISNPLCGLLLSSNVSSITLILSEYKFTLSIV